MKIKKKERENAPQLSIVIPVRNESENIQKALESIKRSVLTPHEIIIVYDFDNDSTLPVLRRIKTKYNNLLILKNKIATGPSGAIRTGIEAASSIRTLVTMADLCDDISQIDHLVKFVPQSVHIICPSRYCKGGKQYLDSYVKVALPRLAGYLLKLLTDIPTSDPTNSFKLYSSSLLKSLSLKSTVSFSVTLEIIAKSHCLGFRIAEIPTYWYDRQHGKTNFKIGPSLLSYFPWFCLALLRNRLFSVSPVLIRKLIL